MDWFERLTGFRELDYHPTRERLAVKDGRLSSSINGRDFAIGEFELASLEDLRSRATCAAQGRLRVSEVIADVRQLHADVASEGALFQVASQFNMLEMTGPEVRPEDGVTRYVTDRTQGPACAMAAGAATIFRNYFVPVGHRIGQTEQHQLDGLAEVGEALSAITGRPVDQLWRMRNGYALCRRDGLVAISEALARQSPAELNLLRGTLRIGLQWNTEVTNEPNREGHVVTQAFCSALPVAYTNLPRQLWVPFATLVLEAAYEATLLAGAINLQGGGSPIVYLTSLGGGAFGNDLHWIDAAMKRALDLAQDKPLDVRIVSYGASSAATAAIVARYA